MKTMVSDFCISHANTLQADRRDDTFSITFDYLDEKHDIYPMIEYWEDQDRWTFWLVCGEEGETLAFTPSKKLSVFVNSVYNDYIKRR